MGLFDKVKQVAGQAQQMARSVKSELESRGIDIDGDDEASRRRRAEEYEQQRRQHTQDVLTYLGFDPFPLLDDATVSAAIGFAVERSGEGGGDYEIGPAYRATGKNDDRSVSILFLYPPEMATADWNAADQAEEYATIGGDPLAELADIGDRAWLVSEEMIVVSVRGRAFYLYAGGNRPTRPTAAGLKDLARVVVDALPSTR